MNKQTATVMLIVTISIFYFQTARAKNLRVKTNMLIVPDEYGTIQEAINAANPGDTIYVKAGIYYENITIDKPINLIGENNTTTIIDGKHTGIRITVTVDNVRIQGFTVRNGVAGIFLRGSSGHKIIGNIVTSNNEGIYLRYSHNTKVYKNIVFKNILSGICLWEATSNTIIGNQILEGKGFGIDFWTKEGRNKIIGNTIKNNRWDGIYMSDSNNNIIFRNNIINDSVEIYGSHDNMWNNKAEGNFWSTYDGEDNDENGIGDTPYSIFNTNNTDYYPLMHPYILGDINHDGAVNTNDANLLKNSFGAKMEEEGWSVGADLNFDGIINAKDAILLAVNYEK
ncbi:MAG: NosD domain-containing protein [Candidatus Heimdallarchaeaceae archaeon]